MTIVAGLLGLAAATTLFVRNDPPRIEALVVAAGFGLLWLLPLRVATLALNAQGWRELFFQSARPPLRLLTWAAFVRNAVNTLLPVAHVGGEVAASRLLIRKAIEPAAAVASVVVETTVTLFVQMAFGLLGIVLLLSYAHNEVLVHLLWMGLIVAFPVGLLFVVLQKQAALFSLLEKALLRLTGKGFMTMGGAAIDGAILAGYRAPLSLLRCAFWQGLSMLGGAGEFWLVLRLLHEPAGLRLVVLLETLMQALQSAAFMVPGALGVQEGGIVAVSGVVGLSTEVALAVLLVRRLRQLGMSAPVLWVWMRSETRAGADNKKSA